MDFGIGDIGMVDEIDGKYEKGEIEVVVGVSFGGNNFVQMMGNEFVGKWFFSDGL